MTPSFQLVSDAQRATTVLSRAPGGSRVYTLLRDGSVASFDPQDDYALSDPLENPSEDDLGEPPHLFQLVAISDVELVAADLDTAYRYRVGSDGLEELSRTGLGGHVSRSALRMVANAQHAFASAGDSLVQVGGPGWVDSDGDDFVHVALVGGALVTGRASGLVELRDALTLDVVRTFQGLSAPVIALAISRDGELVAAADDSTRLRLFRSATGEATELMAPGKLAGLAFTNDGSKLVATGLSRSLSVFEVAGSGQPVAHQRFPELGKGYLLASLLLDDSTLLVSAEHVGLGLVRL
ncbi:MAG: WD40 repeat domain-containing protein [Sandaracinaceae bacterium]|jgi:WD40 repeat protein|nr:WD40 repeat domain-containing protein [Sandaracinaceae bacterium]MBP7686211.1 WD40 repeat domain-containing protein [Deltaproteobacteria bacterium]